MEIDRSRMQVGSVGPLLYKSALLGFQQRKEAGKPTYINLVLSEHQYCVSQCDTEECNRKTIRQAHVR